MRAIIAAIALVLAIGAVMPTEVDARAPRKVEKWGCTFKAVGVGTWASTVPEGPWPWGGLGRIMCSGDRQRLVISMSVLQDTPGLPNRLVGRDSWVRRYGSDLVSSDTGMCILGEAAPTYPYYLRMKVRRKGQPGVVWLRSPNRLNPCGPLGGPAD